MTEVSSKEPLTPIGIGAVIARLRDYELHDLAGVLEHAMEANVLPLNLAAYIAGDFGFTEGGRFYYAEVYLPVMRCLFRRVVDPWSLLPGDYVRDAFANGREKEISAEIGAANSRGIEETSVLVASLEGQSIDAGSLAELIHALPNHRCFVLRTDLRQAGEPGSRFDLQVEHFMRERNAEVASSLAELADQVLASFGHKPVADSGAQS
jgi:hypothetical protein